MRKGRIKPKRYIKPLRVERIILNFLCKESGGIVNVNVVKFKDKTITDKIFNKTYIVLSFKSNLKCLNIANSSSKTGFDVDFLVGLDFYYIFITSNVKRDHFRELIAVESKLGWVLPESLKSNSIHTYLNDTCILRI